MNRQRELLDLIEVVSLGWDKVCEMGQVITGEHPGRTSDQQIIYYKSNTGIWAGIKATWAAGPDSSPPWPGFVLDRAREKGLGRDLPPEWFAQTLLP